MRFTGKTAIITAAASGICRAAALRAAAEGATVACVDVSPAVADVADEIIKSGGRATAWVVDVTDKAALVATLTDIEAAQGPTDILVNGVGRSSVVKGGGEFCDSNPEDWEEVLDISLMSAMRICRHIVPGMRDRGYGRVVNISSVAWLMPTPRFCDYAAAKAGVVGFTRVLAIETAPKGVTVNAVSPGPIETPATAKHPPETRARVEATIPLGHYGQPEDVAAAILFLASDDAKFITAQNIVVGGGRGIV
ncbi:SDR family NAD(P)-dependent oxidoreductase [Pseudoprimorskyibacter insulae]|uniref:3-oxoacyl-[acyl-carrier-protein] reductase FabG n=1 Tax=Pseudoprimorskyibacter insulae TaxID=1695997 RepID=A0A2R8APZ8_9RHOB|nr:SDR family NAD(P)-dependent oxidoreductase [Pseudoprimorskyibacter insulae]SPF78166.1 3-oxoacyl-[acyl-carrier-protein] reductase FabG [Pseudoprimorskyibacter insulae]